MPDLKLGRLPDRTLVKLTVSILPDLAEALSAYAAIYKDTYGREEAVADLVPAILAAFLDSDRTFQARRKSKAPERTAQG
jgi:hypothetical protein